MTLYRQIFTSLGIGMVLVTGAALGIFGATMGLCALFTVSLLITGG